jgi:hypothetical protein
VWGTFQGKDKVVLPRVADVALDEGASFVLGYLPSSAVSDSFRPEPQNI